MATVKISEVNLIQDYVALKNNGNSAVNLKGWRILDTTPTNKKRHEFIFKKDFSLAPDAIVKIWSSIGNNDANNVYQNRKAKIWNNPGDTAELYDANGNLIDSKTVGKPPIGGRGPAPPKPPSKTTISGFVNDSICGQGVKAHLVFESLKGQETIETDSDKNGHYKTELTTGRDYTVTITAIDYDDLPDTINTKAGKDIIKNFKLNPRLEIELGVDFTNIKFTRKDNNKINATQELKDKIVVDFNTDYTFSVTLSIKKGMTNKIKAILVENSAANKDSRGSNTCRISDDNKTIMFTFNPIKQKWEWVALGAFWYVDVEKTKTQLEKTFKYALELNGSYGNNTFSPDEPFKLGEIVVRVSGEKLAYLIQYALLVADWWKALEAATALSIAAAFAWPLAIAAAAAWAAFAVLTAQKDIVLASARDPPQFDKNYKKLVKPKLNIRTQDVKKRIGQLSFILNSIIISRNRLYSAHLKQDKKLTKRHFQNTNKLLNAYDVNAKFISKQIKSATKTLKKYKNYIDSGAVAQFRKSIRRKVLPHSLIINTITSLGISKKDARVVVRAFKSKKFKDKDLSLAPHLDKLSKLVDSFNKLLVKNIRKEIECYRRAKRRT